MKPKLNRRNFVRRLSAICAAIAVSVHSEPPMRHPDAALIAAAEKEGQLVILRRPLHRSAARKRIQR
jgi:hypothetical protein